MVCPDCVEEEEVEDDETGDALDQFVESESEDIGVMSVFGCPMTHDGSLPVESVVYIRRIADISAEGWAHLNLIRLPNWVIIPLESAKDGNHVSEGRPN